MGHRLSVMDYEGDRDDPETEASLAFFRVLKLKWAKYLMAKIAAGLTSDLDIYNDRELVSWRLYLKIFSDIRQKMDEDTENEKRKLYHPACRGFIMTRIDVPRDLELEEESFDEGDKGPADDYTEDAESEYTGDEDEEEESEEEEEESSSDEESSEDETDDEDDDEQGGKAAGGGSPDSKGKKRKKVKDAEDGPDEEGVEENDGADQQLALLSGDEDSSAAAAAAVTPSPTKSRGGSLVEGRSVVASSASYATAKTVSTRTKEWNAEMTSPIFFGYSYVPAQAHDDSIEADRLAVREAEERAVQRTKANRTALLDDFEIAMKNQHANRLRKIAKLQDDYDKARTKREDDLRRLQAELPPVAFNAFKATWELEYLAAEEAFDAEIGKLNDFHEMQCAADRDTVQKRRDELEAFKDAEVRGKTVDI